MCDKGFICNPSNCECEYEKLCHVGEYLDYKNYQCRKRLIDKLVEGCSENVDGNEMLYNETLDVISLSTTPLNVYKILCNSCTIYIVLFVVFFIIGICISSVFIYFHWCLKKDNVSINLILVLKQQFY